MGASMRSRFKRPLHRHVLAHLQRLNARLLAECACYFGGGTRIVLELDEYRESRDVHFLCSDQAGYRRLRETIVERSLGELAAEPMALARDVRADQYGIRTRLGEGEAALKFEIVREARIELAGIQVSGLPVPCLSRPSCFAEKFLANADRGLDRSTLSRDLVDLAFMLRAWSLEDARNGYALACDAYGKDISRKLAATLEMIKDRVHRARVIEALAITDSPALATGLKRLSVFARQAEPTKT
jgi:hypothetical protein